MKLAPCHSSSLWTGPRTLIGLVELDEFDTQHGCPISEWLGAVGSPFICLVGCMLCPYGRPQATSPTAPCQCLCTHKRWGQEIEAGGERGGAQKLKQQQQESDRGRDEPRGHQLTPQRPYVAYEPPVGQCCSRAPNIDQLVGSFLQIYMGTSGSSLLLFW